MTKEKQNIKIKQGGAIEVERDKLVKLRIGEMAEIVGLIQLLCENVLENAQLGGRAVTLSYGNPAVVKIDIGKLSKLSYEEVREALLKLTDMQARLVSEEAAQLQTMLRK